MSLCTLENSAIQKLCIILFIIITVILSFASVPGRVVIFFFVTSCRILQILTSVPQPSKPFFSISYRNVQPFVLVLWHFVAHFRSSLNFYVILFHVSCQILESFMSYSSIFQVFWIWITILLLHWSSTIDTHKTATLVLNVTHLGCVCVCVRGR